MDTINPIIIGGGGACPEPPAWGFEWDPTVVSAGGNTQIVPQGITSVTLPPGTKFVSNNAFAGWWFTRVHNTAQVESIYASAFQDCARLVEIDLSAVTTLYGSAFQGCAALTTIMLPALTGSIPLRAFSGCVALESVDLGAPQGFSSYAFSNCTSLRSLTLRRDRLVPSPPTNTFANVPADMQIRVPSALVAEYQASWSDRADHIIAIEDPE